MIAKIKRESVLVKDVLLGDKRLFYERIIVRDLNVQRCHQVVSTLVA